MTNEEVVAGLVDSFDISELRALDLVKKHQNLILEANKNDSFLYFVIDEIGEKEELEERDEELLD